MEKTEIIKMITEEQAVANKHYKYHCSKGDKYNLGNWFNGQRAILRKLKAMIVKK